MPDIRKETDSLGVVEVPAPTPTPTPQAPIGSGEGVVPGNSAQSQERPS